MRRIAKLNRKNIRRAYDLSSACEQIGDLAKFEFLEELRDEAYFYAILKEKTVEFCFAHWEDDITLEFRMTLEDAVNELVQDIIRPSEHKEATANWANVISSFERALSKLKREQQEHQKYLKAKKENT